jgi:hypothetical protein
MMSDEPSICAVCAWRQDCKKRFLHGKDVSLRCPDFTKDLSIRDREKPDDKEKNSGDHRGGS